ncbi:SDR family NAD(P)-dependent oxidoreductase [Gordonia rhizosphera]|uniref:Putative oxidoreductase n=1 Tax=Gordonia rhizosphera NBRC 16068 TaxID=1108045 RepID=K6X4B8_9ACTN|nr:SDR family oxidoreductase [Gordonia rhizosphera]GAB93649.1 putative oxidoreductase [Gordonia rhizosphera NBRC 16068]
MTVRADLQGQVAVVTGASSGIGHHFCSVLTENGATVIAAARRLDRLEKVVADGAAAEAVQCDVTNADDVERLIEAAKYRGGPDIVVNAAGWAKDTPATETPLDEFRQTLEVDLTAIFSVAATAARAMSDGGSIINIASILGLGASWPITQAAYCAAKGGVINLTRQLGAEWASKGIRVNAIAPGWFPSELTDEMFENEKAMGWIKRNTPIGRPGRLDELDGALLLMASPTSTYLTGQVLAVDGGWTAR